MRIEFFNEQNKEWFSACCDFENADFFDDIEKAEKRAKELREENEGIFFRVVE